MFTRTKLAALLVTLLFSASAVADPITIDTYPDEDLIPGTLGGYETDSFSIDDETTTLNDDETTVASFTNDGNVITLEGDDVTIVSPDWAVPNGSIFGIHGRTVTLNPTTPLGAISFIITAQFSGSAWVSANWTDSSGSSYSTGENNWFAINQDNGNNAIGVGIYAEPGACITSVTVDPAPWWGISAISTADCVSVPEPGSLSLLSLGLLSLGLLARRRNRIV